MDDSESKKKHKKKRKHSDTEETNGNVESVNEILHKSHKKKKKKSKHSETQEDNMSIDKTMDKDISSSGHRAGDIGKNSSESMSGDKVKKEKKKKRKHDDKMEELTIETLEGSSEESQKAQKKAKKKKKKHSKEDVDEIRHCERTNVEISSSAVNNNINDDADFDKNVKKKKKKSKKHEGNMMEDTEYYLKSSAHHIKQTECSEPSNSKKKKVDNKQDINDFAESGSESNVNRQDIRTGQWSSAELGDSDRQNKFMRLLGGFKKGGDSSEIQKKFGLQNKGNLLKRPGGHFAMNKQQQDVYTKNLESDYERAMGMNLNRGIGLGFEKPPEEGKKFHINTKATNSIKFDD